jgi:hypothetical protein
MANSPQRTKVFSLTRFHGHTQKHHSRWDSSGRVTIPSQRPLPDKTQHSQETNFHEAGGLEPVILTSERPQTRVLDRAATGIGKRRALAQKNKTWNNFYGITDIRSLWSSLNKSGNTWLDDTRAINGASSRIL